jgi:hypothetical protein
MRTFRRRGSSSKRPVEVADWQLHAAEQQQQMNDGLARLNAEGKDVIIT